jgi:pimeloyl-ACP methyl ester carboxylesterase
MNAISGERIFQVEFDTHKLTGDVIPNGASPQVLVLHGAGNAHRGDFRLIREELLIHGFSSAAFDFVGHGDTGGELKYSSLISRTRQVCSVVDSLDIIQPFSVIAASMGAYTAVKLLNHYQVKNLILVVPAMYDSKAYSVDFNRGFTEIIRQPESWGNSDAWQILSQYTGRLFVIAGEKDEVIPRGVISRIYDSAVTAEERKLFIAPQASHRVFTELRSNNPDVFSSLFEQIVEMLK